MEAAEEDEAATEVATGMITGAILTLVETTIQGTSQTPVSRFSFLFSLARRWSNSVSPSAWLDLLVARGSIDLNHLHFPPRIFEIAC